VKQKLDHYKASDYTFADARECKFIEKLVQVERKGGGEGGEKENDLTTMPSHR